MNPEKNITPEACFAVFDTFQQDWIRTKEEPILPTQHFDTIEEARKEAKDLINIVIFECIYEKVT